MTQKEKQELFILHRLWKSSVPLSSKDYKRYEELVRKQQEETEVLSNLIDTVLSYIEHNLKEGDVTAIEELLKSCPRENLIAFLPEKLGNRFPQTIDFNTRED